MNAAQRHALAEALCRAVGTPSGAIVPAAAADLHALGALLKVDASVAKPRGKRGRPRDDKLDRELRSMVLEYYTLRAKDEQLEHDAAVAIVQNARRDGSMFVHDARPRSKAYISRMVRKYRDQTFNVLDLIDATFEQKENLRKRLLAKNIERPESGTRK